jgi:hypothetical protein
MHRGSRLKDQIAMRIEGAQKAFFVTHETRFHPFKSIARDEEGIFDRGVIASEAYCPTGLVITATVIWKVQGHDHFSGR